MGDRDAAASDAVVFFGAAGDLTRKQILPAPYRKVQPGAPRVHVVAVARPQWDAARLREHTRDSIPPADAGIDDRDALQRLPPLARHVDGDHRDPATSAALGDARRPVHHPAIPPALFATQIAGLGAAGLAADARVVVEKPFGGDLASARDLNEVVRPVFAADPIFGIDHFSASRRS